LQTRAAGAFWTSLGAKLGVTQTCCRPRVDALLAPSRSKIEVEGDYLVCPFDRTHLGRTQAVCIEDASHLIARGRYPFLGVLGDRWEHPPARLRLEPAMLIEINARAETLCSTKMG
jgi:hypothetical protein